MKFSTDIHVLLIMKCKSGELPIFNYQTLPYQTLPYQTLLFQTL